MKITMKATESRGLYGVYWEQDEEGTRMIVPASKDTPEDIKLMILKDLLTDLNIPISIDEWLLSTNKRRK